MNKVFTTVARAWMLPVSAACFLAYSVGAAAQSNSAAEASAQQTPPSRADQAWNVADRIEYLGAPVNPIRADGEAGTIAYLKQLRCANGTPPGLRFTATHGDSPSGAKMLAYSVGCGTSAALIFVDPSHPGFVEKNAPIGFSMAAAE